jgi:hypothetical protein
MKNVVFWDIKTQFVPHKKHITSPLQVLVSLCYVRFAIPPIRKADRSWAKSGSEKAETFSEDLFTPHDCNNHHNNDEIEKFLDAPCQMSLPIKAFSPKEVSQIIKK